MDFGRPFLVAESRIRLPEGIEIIPQPEAVVPGRRRVASTHRFPWPHDPGNQMDFSIIPDAGAPSEVLYLAGFHAGDTWYEITRPDNRLGARVEWDGSVIPYLWFWQEFGGVEGYPWYGRNYNIGLEPFSSFPSLGLAGAVTNNTALSIGPNEERHFSLEFSILELI